MVDGVACPPAVSIHRGALGLGAVLAGLFAPQVADATTVSRAGGTLVVQGDGTESNQISIAANATTYTVSDSGVASMTAGSGCTGAGPVTCTSITAGFVVDAGAGGDEVTVSADANGQVDGGTGDDELHGGQGSEIIRGGSGADELHGGLGPDILDGGSDRDLVSYADHPALVQVTLDDVANDGSSGELDNVMSSVEDVLGGSGADSLTGSAFANLLRGGAGADTLDGLGGVDSLDGGDDNDLLRSVDLGVDVDTCGSGLDSLVADPVDSISPDCETVQLVSPPAPPDLPPGGGDMADVTPPRLTAFRVSARTFAAAPRGPSVASKPRAARAGTNVGFRISENATVAFSVEHRKAGRRVRGKCRKPTRKNRTRKRCDLLLTGGFTRAAKQGKNSFRFTGRLRGRKLRPGHYYLVARATDGAQNRGNPKRLKFTIVKARRAAAR